MPASFAIMDVLNHRGRLAAYSILEIPTAPLLTSGVIQGNNRRKTRNKEMEWPKGIENEERRPWKQIYEDDMERRPEEEARSWEMCDLRFRAG